MAVIFVQWHTVKAWSVGSVLEYRTRSTVVAAGNLSETLEEKSKVKKEERHVANHIQYYSPVDPWPERW